jgi:hypothetical protein
LRAAAAGHLVAKRLRCLLWWHRWERHVNDEGLAFWRCADCDKFKDDPIKGGLDWPNNAGS